MSKRSDVELRVPAQTAYVSVLRSTSAALAARLDFTVDDIEDLRIAMGEACAMVLDRARPDGELVASYALGERDLTITVTAQADHPDDLDRDGFAWQVLSALTSQTSSSVTAESIAITLAMASELSRLPG